MDSTQLYDWVGESYDFFYTLYRPNMYSLDQLKEHCNGLLVDTHMLTYFEMLLSHNVWLFQEFGITVNDDESIAECVDADKFLIGMLKWSDKIGN